MKIRRTSKNRMRHLLRDRKGASAVEFAIVAPVFLLTMFTLFEIGWFFYTNSVVDASISNASRLVKTGRLQRSGLTLQQQQTEIERIVCRAIAAIADCDEAITVEVATFPDFASLVSQAGNQNAVCPDSSEIQQAGRQFDPGGELSIVRIRICYLHKVLNPAVGVQIAEGDTNRRRVISSIIFRNEPFERNDTSTTQTGQIS